jgi:hypothetical protein
VPAWQENLEEMDGTAWRFTSRRFTSKNLKEALPSCALSTNSTIHFLISTVFDALAQSQRI